MASYISENSIISGTTCADFMRSCQCRRLSEWRVAALAVVHRLEPVQRFQRGKEIAAYCGLDPMERSSGETVRYGHISKQGNRLPVCQECGRKNRHTE